MKQRKRSIFPTHSLSRHFTCQKCGEFHAFQNEYGVIIPIDDGKLNVHHILPVCEGGGDEPENLVTLCVDCHKETHKMHNSYNLEDE